MSSASAIPSRILAGTPEGDRARRHLHVVQHHGVGGHDPARVHHDAVQHDGPDADEAPVLDGAALEVGQVTDHAVVADDGRRLVGGVEHGAVLDRGPGAHDDGAAVAAEHRARPDRRLRADRDGADDDRLGVDERRRIDRGTWSPRA